MIKDEIWDLVLGMVDERYPEADKKRYQDAIADIIISIEELASSIEYDFDEAADGERDRGPDAYDEDRGHNLV